MQRLAVSLALGLVACTPPQPSTVTPPVPVVEPEPEPEPAPPPKLRRVYFEPLELEDRGFNDGLGPGFGFEPVDATELADYVFDGVRPTSVSVLESIEPYLSTRSAELASYSSAGGLLILTGLSGQNQVHRVAMPLGMREQLTFGSSSVEQVAFDPHDGEAILFRADHDGNERYEISHLQLRTRELRPITLPDVHVRSFMLGRGGDLLVMSYSEDGSETLIHALSTLDAPPRELFRGPGSWTVAGSSPDGAHLLLREYLAADEESLDLLELADGSRTRLAGGQPGEFYKAASFAPDGKSIDVLGNRGGEFVSLWRVDMRTQAWTELTPKRRWDIEAVARQPGGKRIAVVSNEDGYSVISLLDPGSKKSVALADPRGVVRELRFADKRTLMATVSSSRSPADVFAFDIDGKQVERWTKSEIGGLPPEHLLEPSLVHAHSSDGIEIPALYYRPRGAGPFAVIIFAHGGPEAQMRPSFKPFFQYLAAERGIAVLTPNIRGSTGYGLTYMRLDDGTKRMDAIADIGTVLDWIASRPELAADRVAIAGASYGGFVTLASLIAHGDRLVAGAVSVGVADIEQFLLHTSEYRRPLRRREYGDERDAATLAWMREVSPLRNADAITQPLFVAHGVNDPRVPVALAQQLTDEVRARGGEVWLMLAQREGHSTQELDTQNEHLRRLATFFERHLLAPPRGDSTSPEAVPAEPEAVPAEPEPALEAEPRPDPDPSVVVGEPTPG